MGHRIPLSRAVLMYTVMALFLAFEMAVQVSPSIMTHQLMRAWHINATWLGIISGSYFLSYTAMQIPAGMLFDRYSARQVAVIPLVICACGALLFGLSHSVWSAIFARIFMGTGSAFAFVSVLVVAAEVFPARAFAFITGITQGVAALGAMGGQYPVIFLRQLVGWRGTMIAAAVAGFILAIVIWRVVKYNKPCLAKVDGDEGVLKGLRTIVRKPMSWIVAVYACMLWLPMSVFASLWGVPFLQARGFSDAQSALLMAMMWVGIAVGSPLFGGLSDRFEARKFFLVILAALGAVMFALILYTPLNSAVLLGGCIFLAGAACAGQALSFAVVRDHNTDHTKAVAIGFNNMAVVISGAFFQPFVGHLIQAHTHTFASDGLPIYALANYRHGLTVVFIAYLIGLLVSATLIRDRRRF